MAAPKSKTVHGVATSVASTGLNVVQHRGAWQVFVDGHPLLTIKTPRRTRKKAEVRLKASQKGLSGTLILPQGSTVQPHPSVQRDIKPLYRWCEIIWGTTKDDGTVAWNRHQARANPKRLTAVGILRWGERDTRDQPAVSQPRNHNQKAKPLSKFEIASVQGRAHNGRPRSAVSELLEIMQSHDPAIKLSDLEIDVRPRFTVVRSDGADGYLLDVDTAIAWSVPRLYSALVRSLFVVESHRQAASPESLPIAQTHKQVLGISSSRAAHEQRYDRFYATQRSYEDISNHLNGVLLEVHNLKQTGLDNDGEALFARWRWLRALWAPPQIRRQMAHNDKRVTAALDKTWLMAETALMNDSREKEKLGKKGMFMMALNLHRLKELRQARGSLSASQEADYLRMVRTYNALQPIPTQRINLKAGTR